MTFCSCLRWTTISSFLKRRNYARRQVESDRIYNNSIKILSLTRQRIPPVWINRQNVESAEKFVYLASLVSVNGGTELRVDGGVEFFRKPCGELMLIAKNQQPQGLCMVDMLWSWWQPLTKEHLMTFTLGLEPV